jgi:hypothetical protein
LIQFIQKGRTVSAFLNEYELKVLSELMLRVRIKALRNASLPLYQANAGSIDRLRLEAE